MEKSLFCYLGVVVKVVVSCRGCKSSLTSKTSTTLTTSTTNMIKDTILQLNEAIDSLIFGDTRSMNWTHRPAPDKWSKKEIIGHLIDSAQINLQRFVRCTYEENFKLTYEQVDWVKAGRYQEMDIHDLFGLWEQLNAQIIHVLEKISGDGKFQTKCEPSAAKPGSACIPLNGWHRIMWII